MIILVINCGSSSIKYQLLDMKNDDLYDIIAKGIVEKIGLPMGILHYAPAGGETQVIDLPIVFVIFDVERSKYRDNRQNESLVMFSRLRAAFVIL